VPKRTNLFQDVVAIIHEHLAGDAVKEESAMLTNRLTGEQREVDVVLRAKVAGHETVIAVEATSGSSPVTAPWVESMVGRHANLPTDRLVLVSESGFTKQARKLAEAENVATITPEDISGDDPAAEIMKAFPSLKPKTVELNVEPVKVAVTRPDGSRVWFKAPEDMDLVLDDGETIWSIERYVVNEITASSNDLMESLGVTSISEDADLGVEILIEPPFTVGGEETGLRAHYLDDRVDELHHVNSFLLEATAHVRVSEIKSPTRSSPTSTSPTPTARARCMGSQRSPS
jgi:hypothetical protein